MSKTKRPPPSRAAAARPASSGSGWLWWTVGAALVIAGVVAVLLSSGGGGGNSNGSTSTAKPGGGGNLTEIASRVGVTGTPLPQLSGSGNDPAVGRAIPQLSGVTFNGAPITVAADGKPQVVIFVAHWCPHCQAEVPRIVALAKAGQIPLEVTGVATGTDPSAGNYPPSAWLSREGWTYPVLVDTKDQTAASAFGLPGYPYLVFVDAQGKVAGRLSGEIGASTLAKDFAALNAGRPLPIPGVPGASTTR